MSDDAKDPVMVPNPYLAAIKANRSSSVGPADELKDGLKAVKDAMDANCWQSPIADTFYGTLTQHERTLSNCRTNALAEFDEAIKGQPAKVESTAWQTHWRNLAGM